MIEYKTGTAKEEQIFLHLENCKANFHPELDKKVNIRDYSVKMAKNAKTFEAWSGEKLVGLVAAYMNDEVLKKAYITNVSVESDFMGKGISKMLMKNCIDKAKIEKFQTIELEVSEKSIPAIRLYETFGFKRLGNKGENLFMILNLKN